MPMNERSQCAVPVCCPVLLKELVGARRIQIHLCCLMGKRIFEQMTVILVKRPEQKLIKLLPNHLDAKFSNLPARGPSHLRSCLSRQLQRLFSGSSPVTRQYNQAIKKIGEGSMKCCFDIELYWNQ